MRANYVRSLKKTCQKSLTDFSEKNNDIRVENACGYNLNHVITVVNNETYQYLMPPNMRRICRVHDGPIRNCITESGHGDIDNSNSGSIYKKGNALKVER